MGCGPSCGSRLVARVAKVLITHPETGETMMVELSTVARVMRQITDEARQAHYEMYGVRIPEKMPDPIWIGDMAWCGRCMEHIVANGDGAARTLCPGCLEDWRKKNL
jgi:hypothetical protein